MWRCAVKRPTERPADPGQPRFVAQEMQRAGPEGSAQARSSSAADLGQYSRTLPGTVTFKDKNGLLLCDQLRTLDRTL
jgi:hypothetical protein